MTVSERSQQLSVLRFMQQEFENIANAKEGGVIVITVPGTTTKHVYSDSLAAKVARSIARTLEQERVSILSRNHQKKHF